MQLYTHTEDLQVMGIQVTTFPNGIKEAFESLMKSLGSNRAFYGVSWLDESNNVIYYAVAAEAFQGEAKHYNYESLTIVKGEYKTEVVYNWLSKTDCIKDVFHNLMGNDKPNQKHPCIEWYKSDVEMLCMIKLI